MLMGISRLSGRRPPRTFPRFMPHPRSFCQGSQTHRKTASPVTIVHHPDHGLVGAHCHRATTRRYNPRLPGAPSRNGSVAFPAREARKTVAHGAAIPTRVSVATEGGLDQKPRTSNLRLAVLFCVVEELRRGQGVTRRSPGDAGRQNTRRPAPSPGRRGHDRSGRG